MEVYRAGGLSFREDEILGKSKSPGGKKEGLSERWENTREEGLRGQRKRLCANTGVPKAKGWT